MGERVIKFSDLNQKEIADGEKIGTMAVRFGDARRGTYLLDVTDEEVAKFAEKGIKAASQDDVKIALGLK